MSTSVMRDVASWAAELGRSEDSLLRLGCTLDECGNLRWPERDGDGAIIGWSTRYPNGKTLVDAGGRRGLCYIHPMPTYAGSSAASPIILPEGLSDTATAIDAGHDAIGRPSATGGNALLVAMVTGRHVCVVGENDGGAGKTGADKCAAELHPHAASVRIVYPPKQYKDLRKWANAEGIEAVRPQLATSIDDAPTWTPTQSNTATAGDDETPPALPERWIPRRLTDLADDDPVEYVIPGLLARRHVTILSARAKCGKTTWLTAMIRAMRDGLTFCGLPIEAGRVLLITEESFGLWKRRNEERAIGDHLRIMSRPFMLRPSMSEWGAFCRHVARLVEREGFAAVIVDTLGRVSPVESENDAAEVTGAMMPLAAIGEAGAAVLVVHHQRKGDGDACDGVRGSGAFTANVDIVVEMRHFAATDRSDRRRTLNIVGRFSECPDDEIVVELTADGEYRALGNRAEAKARDKWAALGAILPTDPPGLTADEIRAAWPEGEKAPGKSALFTTLQVGRDNGRYGASGTGKRNDPLRFYTRLPADSSTRPAPSVSLLDDSIGHPEIGGRTHSSIHESIDQDEWTKRAASKNGRAKPDSAVDETPGIAEGVI